MCTLLVYTMYSLTPLSLCVQVVKGQYLSVGVSTPCVHYMYSLTPPLCLCTGFEGPVHYVLSDPSLSLCTGGEGPVPECGRVHDLQSRPMLHPPARPHPPTALSHCPVCQIQGKRRSRISSHAAPNFEGFFPFLSHNFKYSFSFNPTT